MTVLLAATAAQAQITIGGNVYGGGNAGNLGGSTSVSVYAGDIKQVYGGARQANVGGSTFVNIDGAHMSGDIVVNAVYGGNDIAGTIGGSVKATDPIPAELTDAVSNNITTTAGQNTKQYNAFVLTTPEPTNKHIFIGQLYGGGNGAYDYESTDSPYKGKVKPELGKTYLEIRGGTIGFVFGGGNCATVTGATDICIDNTSEVTTDTHLKAALNTDDNGIVTRMGEMGLNTVQTLVASTSYQFARVFGGNNVAEMDIRPTWHLKRGQIRDLFSGGNAGNMTHPNGILLKLESNDITVNNVYGGCRMADVNPDKNVISAEVIDGTSFPKDYAARLLITGGNINNVYGGNDISGNIYGGNAVGIHCSINGDVYGGGNGSYAYTDQEGMKSDPRYVDYFYDVPSGKTSVEALNAFRPNAEAVSIRVVGTAEKKTVIGGAIYCGGNSATLHNEDTSKRATAQLKIGSYVIADKVFLGNNGENIKSTETLQKYADSDFSSLDLTDETVFSKYMDGVAMMIEPEVTFDDDYEPYSTYFGSFFCGGNVGSMKTNGVMEVSFNDEVVIYDKVVGGSNEANVYQSDYNAQYLGGLLGGTDSHGNKLILNFGGLKIQPKRWKMNGDDYVLDSDGNRQLEWNTVDSRTFHTDTKKYEPMESVEEGGSTTYDPDRDPYRRFQGGNIYGGCYSNGHVNGNVVINLNASLVDRKGENSIFDEVEEIEGEAKLYDDNYNISRRFTGVLLGEQGMDPLGRALNVFGGGYGGDSEIWGSTTINLNAGYTFQIFGGGEQGAIGRAISHTPGTNALTYEYNPAYSTTINLKDKNGHAGTYRGDTDNSDGIVDHEEMAEAEFIYGGSFEGVIAGDTHINLGNGRIFNTFAGSCNADILGHTETYVGRNSDNDADMGFPWIRDHIYGGNDLGGRILGTTDFTERVSEDVRSQMYNTDVVKASAYTEYIQGRVEYIFGGCYGDYDYTDPYYNTYTYATGDTDATTENLGTPRSGFYKPWMHNAFVNFRPNQSNRNAVAKVYGAGQGHAFAHASDAARDDMQENSYVLIDAPQSVTKYQNMEVFGAGDYSGVDSTAIIDLMRGHVKDVFGASYKEGITRRTIVNVPTGSTIRASRLFGGAYGVSNDKPCDVYEAHINYNSGDALVGGYRTGIFGGNNNCRRTLYSFVNINAPVFYDKTSDYVATVFGGGYGENTWSEYTEVNLNDGARVFEAYGGGYGGQVLNKESLLASGKIIDLPTGYTADYLDSELVKPNRLGTKCNANVNINRGANVSGYLYNGSISGGYCYGGGYGATATVSGTTYIGLHGGTVFKDLYAGGTSGAVMDLYKVALDGNTDNDFVAGTNAYIEGGTVRNVYGGGWEGNVGYTKMENGTVTEDIPGTTNVVIGIRRDQPTLPDGYGYYCGVPAIQRNAYAGGEGGAVFGDARLKMNNGYIGYTYDTTTRQYEEKIHDETWSDHVGKDRLSDCGNIFGGGYDDDSSVDHSSITMWGGTVRNSLFGGGEIATIGRGKTRESGEDNKVRELEAIYKAGKTEITMYNGHVKRNIFGGGKGYNILGYGGVHGFYTDGYVFGQTEIRVHGGEVGTEAGLAEGYGNVFGGGDVGYVYSKGYYSTGSRQTGTGSPNHFYYYDDNGDLTEDCKVVVAPMLQVRANGTPVTFEGTTYGPYDYVPTDYLNTLPADKTAAAWTNLYTGDKLSDGSINPDDPEERGIQIRNAVFAGGNVSSNSESYNNATTVFGNTTATLYDVYHRDFITVGTEHTGGLYGGGNLSVVNGYRELNITNYGTDYYGMDEQISLQKYQTLTNRERAYFKLEYQCQRDITIGSKVYKKDERISEDEYNDLPTDFKNTTYWIQYGFCSIYAGRLLNTIQRADFCGVYGSRLVLQGAKDRVADVGDATEYTINRVGEVSLNQQRSVAGDIVDGEPLIHGNYFGIYSIVNYMGNLTSDVTYTDPRRYVERGQTYTGDVSYYDWKTTRLDKRDRNNGTSYNQVALASGVFLELTSENSTTSNKIYGDITGVVELDLINVKKDIEGGGYVYARNEHRIPKFFANKKNVLLSEYNKAKTVGNVDWRDEAYTHKRYVYSADDENADDGAGTILGVNEPYSLKSYQTSGNFIHKSKRIVDDCYPNIGLYQDQLDENNQVRTKASPAHYWYIKGEVYIYDQPVSAYAGSASAYSKEVRLPLTITAGSNGRLKLLNVQPNRYAYYADETRTDPMGTDGIKVDNESTTYHLNEVISWWDWNQLSQNEQKLFVRETVVNVDSCTIDGTPYAAGTCVLENDATIHDVTAWQTFLAAGHTVLNAAGTPVSDLTTLFRSSNNIGHDTGYVLTFDIDNNTDPSRPTYTLREGQPSGLYGQRLYDVGEIISEEVYQDYTTTVVNMSTQPENQAEVQPAYVAITAFGTTQAGNAIAESVYQALSATDQQHFAPAMVCVNTMQLGAEDYVLLGELVSATDENLASLAQRYLAYNNAKTNADPIDQAQALQYIKDNLSKAYYCSTAGLYGGQYFESGVSYGALKSWCSLTDSRDKFGFNYDAFDVLIDPEYHGEGYTETYYHSPYSDTKAIEYEAYYLGTGTFTYYDNDNTQHTINSGQSITSTEYERVRNDQLHYTRIQVEQGSDIQTVYIVNENIINNGTPYAKGQDISLKDYNALTTVNKAKVSVVNFQKGSAAAVKYYCYEDYTPGTTFTTEKGTAGAQGSVISDQVFNDNDLIPNYQKRFDIRGSEPTETTTLYVARESNAKDVTSDKIISVVYQYTYYESDDEGEGVSLVNELHVVNIRLRLESGAPEIGPLTAPPAVLPGKTVGLKAPSVNPGVYEVLTSGWELFMDEHDAETRQNGIPFTNNGTPLYWYQDNKVWLAFYSKTYLGKTYSNYVPITVANYHDIDDVMADTEHHLYVDHPEVARNSKIYIDNRTCKSDATKSELDLLKDFFDLSVNSSSAAVAGHATLDPHVRGGADLEFILNSDVSPKAYTDWTPIGTAGGQCFEGNLHGDGYTISRLSNSLFGNLCGNVYNLGVTGSFTSAGIVDTGAGYVENCWISTTGAPDGTVHAVFGNPTRDSGKQVVNCYYPVDKHYDTTDNGRGLATPMTETQFYNGTVAYNLNGFYLNKRYYDKNRPSAKAYSYNYLKSVNGTVSEEMSTGYYPASYAFYPLDEKKSGSYGYVEDRFADGDFIYAGGTVPEAIDERMRVITSGTTNTVKYAPIWPDDYIYFGQVLSFGHGASTHEDSPTHIVKSSGRLPHSNTSTRVYRAPAYYQSSDMDKVHFNSWAVIAAKSAPKTITDTDLKSAYPNMTAIDFAGHNDNTWALGFRSQGFAAGSPAFYPPLLDNDDELLNIVNEGETPNLLVYAPSADSNEQTLQVLTTYFAEPDYASYDAGDDYRRVEQAVTSSIHGHLVQSDLTATSDHLLVDKRDFNCPLAYTFAAGKRMWYQRTPELFVNLTKGWETVSLPFTAELVTTQQKGEITHFFSGSRTIEGSTAKIGHEYWLRQYAGKKANSGDTFTAAFNYPTAGGEDKTVSNTFLWDYYYSLNDQHDSNADSYQTYYESSRTYEAYPLLAQAKPYIVGFPGQTYYEFDLSGEWTAQNTAIPAPAQLDKQTISFVSAPGTAINVSDNELTAEAVDGYRFVPNYMSQVVDGYMMNADGSSFEATPAGGYAATPFRPYFTAGAAARGDARTILFDSSDTSFTFGDLNPSEDNIGDGTLHFKVSRHKISVTSSLRHATDVRIVNTGGQTIASFTIQPDETIDTTVNSGGVYIVHADGGRYTKKLALR